MQGVGAIQAGNDGGRDLASTSGSNCGSADELPARKAGALVVWLMGLGLLGAGANGLGTTVRGRLRVHLCSTPCAPTPSCLPPPASPTHPLA